MNKLFRNISGLLRGDSTRIAEEAYLNEATTLVDLEYRQRQIDRGHLRGQRRNFGF